MNLDQLIEYLTGLRDEEGVPGTSLVLIAHQPNYPLQCSLGGVVVDSPNSEEIEELRRYVGGREDDPVVAEQVAELKRLEAESRQLVYILEGSSRPWDGDRELSPYASRDLWDR